MLQMKFASWEWVSGLMCLLILGISGSSLPSLGASPKLPTLLLEGCCFVLIYVYMKRGKGCRKMHKDFSSHHWRGVAGGCRFSTCIGEAPESSLIFQVMHKQKLLRSTRSRRVRSRPLRED